MEQDKPLCEESIEAIRVDALHSPNAYGGTSLKKTIYIKTNIEEKNEERQNIEWKKT